MGMVLSEEQQKAVEHVEGPMMVIAGPGSGKTAVLTRRIQRMVEVAGIRSSEILVITFTRAAAMEMRQRYLLLMNESDTDIHFGTFHSIFYSLLQKRVNEKMKLLEMKDAENWITEYVIEKLQCDRQEAQWRAFFVLSEYSRMLNNGTYDKKRMDAIMGNGVFEDIVLYYREVKRIRNCIDFDDMLIRLRELLLADKEFLEECRNEFVYLLVDEFQDINSVQYQILCLLAEPRRNLFIVGDDDQSIYGFRGSQPEYLLQFPKQYPEAKRVDLSVNYRCCYDIVKCAEKLIRNNHWRYKKNIKAASMKKGKVHIVRTKNEDNEAVKVCSRIHEYVSSMDYKEIAVLYRTHMQCRKLREKLILWNIPFWCEDEDIPESVIKEDLRCILRCAEYGNTEDIQKAASILLESIPVYRIRAVLNQDVKTSVHERICVEEMQYHFRKLNKKSLEAALVYIWNSMGYKQYMKKKSSKEGMPWKVIEVHFRNIIHEAQKAKDKKQWLTMKDEVEKRGVRLLTMHGAKGLEFQAVIILDANEGICPYEYAATEKAMEEERRLFYVAMTRAKQFLDIFYTEKGKRRSGPSRFIGELKY